MLLCSASVLAAMPLVLPQAVPTQVVNLALLVSALLGKRSCHLPELARAALHPPGAGRILRPAPWAMGTPRLPPGLVIPRPAP